MFRLNVGARYLMALLLGWACLLTAGASSAPAQDKQAPDKKESADKGAILSKTDKLTDDDEKDTSPQTGGSHRKVYKVKLKEGQAVRIDLASKDFDTFLRLEDAKGKQLAFNDDIDVATKNLNSRLIFVAPKAGEYRIIATTFEKGKTGEFTLEVKPASATEIAQGRVQQRIDQFPDASPAEQKKVIAEVIKEFEGKGENLSVKDAQLALQLAMGLDESNPELTRATCKTFGKLFNGASDKQLAQVSKILDSQVVRNLDKIGKDIDIAGKTTDGKEFNLKDLKGKVVLIDFWATWCPPCVAEVPNIVSAYKKYHGKGFEVIGVSLDRSNDAITKFVEARKLPWQCINIEDSKKLAEKYNVNAIPHPILVDQEGRIASMRARGPQLERSLERLLSQKSEKSEKK